MNVERTQSPVVPVGLALLGGGVGAVAGGKKVAGSEAAQSVAKAQKAIGDAGDKFVKKGLSKAETGAIEKYVGKDKGIKELEKTLNKAKKALSKAKKGEKESAKAVVKDAKNNLQAKSREVAMDFLGSKKGSKINKHISKLNMKFNKSKEYKKLSGKLASAQEALKSTKTKTVAAFLAVGAAAGLAIGAIINKVKGNKEA